MIILSAPWSVRDATCWLVMCRCDLLICGQTHQFVIPQLTPQQVCHSTRAASPQAADWKAAVLTGSWALLQQTQTWVMQRQHTASADALTTDLTGSNHPAHADVKCPHSMPWE